MLTRVHYNLLVAALVAATSLAAQSPFGLDPNFQTLLEQDYVSSLLPLENGQVLISGRLVFDNDDPFVPSYGARLTGSGSREPSFPMYPAMGGRIVRWADKLYVGAGQGVYRLNMDGVTDQTFGPMFLCPYFSSLQGGDFHVFPDGRLLLAGTHQLNDPVRGFVGYYNLIWFTNSGCLDTTRIHRQSNGTIRRIRQQPDGRFLCSGNVQWYEGQPVTLVFRVEEDGALDPGFNTPLLGIPTDIGSAFSGVGDMEPLADGRVLVGGYWRLNGSTDTIGVVRVLPDGALDPDFIPARLSTTYATTGWVFPSVNDILPLPDGRMIIAGNFDRVNGVPRGGLAMLNADGSVNKEHFAGAWCGEYNSPLGGLPTRSIKAIVPAPDGSYYIHGQYWGYHDGATHYPEQRFVSRLHGFNVGVREQALAPLQLQPNPTYGPLTVALPANTQAQHAEVLDAHGRVVFNKPLRAQAEQVQLDVSSLSDGAYVLRLRMQDGGVRHGRLVIAK